MKKKVLSIALAAALGATMFAGCGSGESDQASTPASTSQASTDDTSEGSADATSEESTDATSEASGEATGDVAGKKVEALFFSLEGEFYNLFNTLLDEGLSAQGVEYNAQSANMDDVTLITQLENAVANGTDLCWVWALNGDAVADACKAALDAGTMVYTFVQDPGEENRTRARGTDEEMVGQTIGQIATQWADENRPDAGDGEISAIVFGNTSSTNMKERTDAVVANLDSRFNIVENVDVEMSTPEAKTTMENMVAKYGDTIDAYFCVSGNQVIGICSYLDSDACMIDKEKVGVIGTEITEELADYVNKGLYYGGAVIGGNPNVNAEAQVEEMLTLLAEGPDAFGDETFSPVEVTVVDSTNLAEYGY
jgi:ABC-type sugar transport system substrate-binding protein